MEDLGAGEVDTAYFPSAFIPVTSGTHRIELTVVKAGDPVPMNNTLTATFDVMTGKALAGVGTEIPRAFYLAPVKPNPFRTATTVEFGLPRAAHVEIGVYDATGRLVKLLVDGEFAAGIHNVGWDGRMSGS